MKETTQFIEDAINGGYVVDTSNYTLWLGKNSKETYGESVYKIEGTDSASVAEILLDPSAWRAVGVTRGWKEKTYTYWGGIDFGSSLPTPTYLMMRFIYSITEGKSIEEALLAIKS